MFLDDFGEVLGKFERGFGKGLEVFRKNIEIETLISYFKCSYIQIFGRKPHRPGHVVHCSAVIVPHPAATLCGGGA